MEQPVFDELGHPLNQAARDARHAVAMLGITYMAWNFVLGAALGFMIGWTLHS